MPSAKQEKSRFGSSRSQQPTIFSSAHVKKRFVFPLFQCTGGLTGAIRCSMAILMIFLIILLLTGPATAGYWQYRCKNGQSGSTPDYCKGKGGVTEKKYIAICGDGILDVGEQCDDGSSNSDSSKNACRTDCRRAYCGDGTIDSGEQCDDGGSNSNTAANTCRRNCRLPVCGDGVVDNDRHRDTGTVFNEVCDDGNNDNSDGCMADCRTCLQLDQVGNIDITSDTALCPAQYLMDDYGDYGAIIIKATGVTLDCQGAILVGEGRGVGILNFRSNDVIIKNCTIRGYDVGLRVQDARNVSLQSNNICDNLQRNIELIDAVDVDGYKPSMAATTKCATAQIQQQSKNLAKIAVATPSGSSTGKMKGRSATGYSTTRQKSPQTVGSSPKGKPAKTATVGTLAVNKRDSRPKPGKMDLIPQASRARWSSRSGRVVYGSDRLTEIGQVRSIARGQLADGKRASNLLLTQPDMKNGGYIQGIFPAVKLGKKARFSSTVAMLKGANAADTLSFEIIVRSGGKTSVVKKQRVRGNQSAALNADLSRWSGKNVQLILRASNLKGSQSPPAVWINPKVTNP